MDHYDNIPQLIDNLENSLDKTFVCGLGATTDADIRQLRELAEDCERFGLAFATEALGEMASLLEQQRHSMEFEVSGLAKNFCVLDVYLSSLRSKLELTRVREIYELSGIIRRNS